MLLLLQGEELDKKGFGGIYGVGKAAVHQPALVVLSHTPKDATETVAWVGKGIVYDTGGLSIKGMYYTTYQQEACDRLK
jgi:probable aminopeptidase NPEPL1